MSDKTRPSAPEQKKLADDARLLRAWKAWHREQRETALAGPHGSALAELFRMAANLKCVQPAQLIGFAHSVDWTAVDYATRLTTVHEIGMAIVAFREKHRMAPFDDGLSEEPENPFNVIRSIVLSRSRP